MKNKIITYLLCIAGGVILTLAIQLNSGLGVYAGVLQGSLITHLTGTLFTTILIFKDWKNKWWLKTKTVPKYLFLGGAFGFFSVVTSNLAIPIIGITIYTALYVIFSLLFSIILDHFGLFGFPKIKTSPKRILGILFAVAGIYLLKG